MLVVVITALVIISGLVGTLLYVLHQLAKERDASSSAVDSYHSQMDKNVKLTLENADIRATNANLASALDTKTLECIRGIDALKRAEANREELLQELVRMGDPRSIAAGIRDQLSAFAKMSGNTDPPTKSGG